MELTFRFQLSPKEHAQACRAMLNGTRQELRWAFFSAALSFVTVSVLLFWWSDLSSASRLLLALPLILLFLYSLLVPVWLPVHFGRAYARDPIVFSEQAFTLSPAGIGIESTAGLTTARWPAIREVRDQKEFYYFFTLPSYAYFLPKRAMASEQQHEDLRQLVRSYAMRHNLNGDGSPAPIAA